MASIKLIDAFQEFKESENIDRETMIKVVEDVFRTILRKKYGSDENFDLVINSEKGDLEIFKRREIRSDDDVDNQLFEISYSEAIKIEPDFEIGEHLIQEFDMSEFGRRTILSAKQIMTTKINELKYNLLYERYKDRIGEIVTVEINKFSKKEVICLDDNGNELVLYKSDQLFKDFFKKGEYLKAVISHVELVNGKPVILLSRSNEKFLHKLLEEQIPEVFDGLITVKNIYREAGERSKVIVESYDDRIDPVGICVGPKGSKLFAINKELKGEYIDIVNYTSNKQLLIQRLLSPAKISSIEVDSNDKKAYIYLSFEDMSKAIGKNGANIRLAKLASGYDIILYNEDEESDEEFDFDLDEFLDEVDQWVVDEFKKSGLETINSVLKFSDSDLVKMTSLELETIVECKRIFLAELELQKS